MSTNKTKKVRAKPRRERTYPQVERVVSLNFPDGIKACVKDSGSICFVPVTDFRKLERKYLQLFKRYQRAKSK